MAIDYIVNLELAGKRKWKRVAHDVGTAYGVSASSVSTYAKRWRRWANLVIDEHMRSFRGRPRPDVLRDISASARDGWIK